MLKARNYRKFVGLTQGQMAKKLGISVSSYRNKESERTPFNDKEKIAFRNIVAQTVGEITIDSIFFDKKYSKSIQG
ncbi:transcriptional regulator [Levilactobacillus brevis]|nr:transcriptional regulator [Levilactobacillus brevis]